MGMKTGKDPLSFREGAFMTFGLGAIISAWATFISWTSFVEKRGQMLQWEWHLKYDKNGQPRPEYWQRQLLTEQLLEKEREEKHAKRKTDTTGHSRG